MERHNYEPYSKQHMYKKHHKTFCIHWEAVKTHLYFTTEKNNGALADTAFRQITSMHI